MREFWRTMTGPKQGVYSVRRARSAHRNASTDPSHHRIQIPGRPRRSYRLGGLHFGRYTRCLLSMAVGVQRHCDSG